MGVTRSFRSVQGAGADSTPAETGLTRIFNHEVWQSTASFQRIAVDPKIRAEE
jgi:hypothetical protein